MTERGAAFLHGLLTGFVVGGLALACARACRAADAPANVWEIEAWPACDVKELVAAARRGNPELSTTITWSGVSTLCDARGCGDGDGCFGGGSLGGDSSTYYKCKLHAAEERERVAEERRLQRVRDLETIRQCEEALK